ncbi:MAG TPA: hypothetical protein VIY51_20040 [Xanthobacteraceae bacterium]
MRNQIVAVMCAALAGALALPGPAFAQQKTVKACQDEWRANKDANQAAGVTEKAYVDKCRAAGAAATPAAAPATTPAATPAAKPAAAPAVKPAPSPAPTMAAPATKPSTAPATAAAGANEFAAEALAKAHCPTDTIVWANLSSKIYHFSGHKDYGNTKEGAYMCEKDAVGQGVRAAKNEKHP